MAGHGAWLRPVLSCRPSAPDPLAAAQAGANRKQWHPDWFLPDADYPVCEIPLSLGDRFLLYTDGVIEPENTSGDSFGDREFEDIVRKNQLRSPSDLSEDLLRGVRRWQPASVTQQDDITLIVIDIAQSPWNAHSEIVDCGNAGVVLTTV